jgi:predicted nucleic acid-binding protein
MIVVSDTSPIANLIQIGRLELLGEVFQEVLIPPVVYEEIMQLGNFGIDLSDFKQANWIKTQSIRDENKINDLLGDLDAGESQAIVLAQEVSADWILIDERAGTKIAESLGLHPIGLVGVLIKAKQRELIEAVVPVILELREIAGFWIGDKFLARMKNELGE